MQLWTLFTDEDAVSPVIGVILMVAITVILAAAVGVFVMGFGDQTTDPPSVTWNVDEQVNDSGGGNLEVTFTHYGGGAVDLETNEVRITPSDDLHDHPSVTGSDNDTLDHSEVTDDGLMTGGDQFVANYSAIDSGTDVQIVWSESGSDETTVIGTHTVSNTV